MPDPSLNAGAATSWGVGEYPLMAQRLEPAALAAVELAAVGRDDRVLDVATGTGNAALLAAERGGKVVGADLEPALLQVAERRARDSGREVRWVSGDMAALPVADHSHDVVLSVFGAMYAPDHAAAAGELARVAAAEARVVLASWAPGSVMARMGRLLSAYLPPPPAGSAAPSRWGDRDALVALLEPAGLYVSSTSIERVSLQFQDAAGAADFLIRTAGHVVAEQQRLVQEGRWNDLRQELITFVEGRAEQVGERLALALEYLLASAHT